MKTEFLKIVYSIALEARTWYLTESEMSCFSYYLLLFFFSLNVKKNYLVDLKYSLVCINWKISYKGIKFLKLFLSSKKSERIFLPWKVVLSYRKCNLNDWHSKKTSAYNNNYFYLHYLILITILWNSWTGTTCISIL